MARTGKGEHRRAQIVDGLATEMAEHGYDGASVARIARRAGLTPGLVHYHFGSKIEILEALLGDLVSRHHARLDGALEEAGEDARERVAAFLDVHLATGASADPRTMACWVMLAGEALRHPEVRIGYREALTALLRRLEAIIQDGVEDRTLRCDAPDQAAAALLALVEGYYVIAATTRELIPPGSAAPCARRMATGLLGERP